MNFRDSYLGGEVRKVEQMIFNSKKCSEHHVAGTRFVKHFMFRLFSIANSILEKSISPNKATERDCNETKEKLMTFKNIQSRRESKILSVGSGISTTTAAEYHTDLEYKKEKKAKFNELAKNDSPKQKRYRSILTHGNCTKKFLMKFLDKLGILYNRNDKKEQMVILVMKSIGTLKEFIQLGKDWGFIRIQTNPGPATATSEQQDDEQILEAHNDDDDDDDA